MKIRLKLKKWWYFKKFDLTIFCILTYYANKIFNRDWNLFQEPVVRNFTKTSFSHILL